MNNDQNIREYIQTSITGSPSTGKLGMQSDWWTGISPDLERSHGSYLYDLCTNREVLDFMTFYATSPIAYDHPGLRQASFLKEIQSIALHKPSNADFWTPLMAEFINTFRTAMGESGRDLPYLFLISGGAPAVENAMKIAFDWKIKKNLDFENLSLEEINRLAEKKRLVGDKIISFEEAFHGRSGYTLSLTHTSDIRKYMFYPKFQGWPRVKNPKIIHPLEENLEKVIDSEKTAIKQILECIETEKDKSKAFAAIIIEPIQGEGGDNHFRKEFFEELRKIADAHEILLIYDEVQTGMGLTGKMWCYEHFGDKAKPDIISFGKKFHVCGTLASRKIGQLKFNVFSSDKDKRGKEWGKSRINSTFGGDLLDMVRCKKVLEIVQSEKLINNAAQMGEYFLKQIRSLEEENQNLFTNIRGRGLMIAFDLKRIKERPEREIRDMFRNIMKKNGIFALPTGRKGIRFRPHLDITKEEIDTGINLLEKSMRDLKAQSL